MHYTSFAVAILSLGLLPFPTAQECEEYYKKLGSDHTMCVYLTKGCDLLPIGISKADRKKIIDVHNKFRTEDGALPVEWDDQLESIAQTWANQCQFDHDKNRKIYRFDVPFYVGQNIALSADTKDTPPDYDDLIMKWHKEKKDHTQGELHYLQLVAPLTDKIGCGLSKYKDNGKFTYLFVCNYNPGAGDEAAEKFGEFFHQHIRKPEKPKAPRKPRLPAAPTKPRSPAAPTKPRLPALPFHRQRSQSQGQSSRSNGGRVQFQSSSPSRSITRFQPHQLFHWSQSNARQGQDYPYPRNQQYVYGSPTNENNYWRHLPQFGPTLKDALGRPLNVISNFLRLDN